VTAWSNMACCHQTRKLGLTCWPTGLQNSVDCILVYFWPEMGTTSTAFVADVLHKLPCPFSEKAPVETDLPFCTTSQLCVIALNVLVIFFFYLYRCCIVTYFSVCKYLSGNCFYCTLIFLCCALTLTLLKCWAVNR